MDYDHAGNNVLGSDQVHRKVIVFVQNLRYLAVGGRLFHGIAEAHDPQVLDFLLGGWDQWIQTDVELVLQRNQDRLKPRIESKIAIEVSQGRWSGLRGSPTRKSNEQKSREE